MILTLKMLQNNQWIKTTLTMTKPRPTMCSQAMKTQKPKILILRRKNLCMVPCWLNQNSNCKWKLCSMNISNLAMRMKSFDPSRNCSAKSTIPMWSRRPFRSVWTNTHGNESLSRVFWHASTLLLSQTAIWSRGSTCCWIRWTIWVPTSLKRLWVSMILLLLSSSQPS